MNLREFGIAIAVVSVVACAASGNDAEPTCAFKRGANLDMTTTHAGVPAVPVMINGTTKPFVISISGVYSSISKSAADELKLPTELLSKQIRFAFSDGSTITRLAHPDVFQVGQLPLKHMGLTVVANAHEWPDYSGLLASDILHFFDLEFDFANEKFQMYLPNDCGDRVVHWPHTTYGVIAFHENRPYVSSGGYISSNLAGWQIIAPAKLDGVDVDVIFETGTEKSSMTLEDAREIFPSGSEEKSLKRIDDKPDSGDERYSYPFGALTLDTLTVNHPNIVLHPNKLGPLVRLGRNRPQLFLGMSVLRRLHFYVNYRDTKLYLTEASPQPTAPGTHP
jgi:hypothetical protein